QDGRVLQESPRDGEPLALSPRERHPALADVGVVRARQLPDEVVRPRRLRCRFEALLRDVAQAIGDVRPDGIVEQERRLCDQRNLRRQRPERRLAAIASVGRHATARAAKTTVVAMPIAAMISSVGVKIARTKKLRRIVARKRSWPAANLFRSYRSIPNDCTMRTPCRASCRSV